jgi:hypothetical protein
VDFDEISVLSHIAPLGAGACGVIGRGVVARRACSEAQNQDGNDHKKMTLEHGDPLVDVGGIRKTKAYP